MADRAAPPADQRTHGDALRSRCHGCGASAAIGRGIVETADGCRCPVTYADTDIVVWDCPSCSSPNADVLTEG